MSDIERKKSFKHHAATHFIYRAIVSPDTSGKYEIIYTDADDVLVLDLSDENDLLVFIRNRLAAIMGPLKAPSVAKMTELIEICADKNKI